MNADVYLVAIGTACGLGGLAPWLPAVANTASSLVTAVSSAYFAKEAFNYFTQYETERVRRIGLLQEPPAFSELYRQYLPTYAQPELVTIDAAVQYLDQSRCLEMEEFMANYQMPPADQDINPFQTVLNETAPEVKKLELAVQKQAWIEDYTCRAVEGRLHMAIRKHQEPYFRISFKMHESAYMARRTFFHFVDTYVDDLRNEGKTMQDLLRLNEAHKNEAAKVRNYGVMNLITAAACGVGTIATGVYSTFRRCFERPQQRRRG